MLVRSVAALFSGILFAQGALAQLTPDQVVFNIGIVTTLSGNLNTVLGRLSITPSPQQAQKISKTVVEGFGTIINDLAGDVTAMNATPPFADGVAQPVVDALRDFVKVHQLLLSTVIGKHSIFAQFGVTAPIAAVLRNLEAGIDGFAFSMIDLIPTRKTDVTTDKNSLDTSVGDTISLYVQFCIPSPLYPTVPPVCIST